MGRWNVLSLEIKDQTKSAQDDWYWTPTVGEEIGIRPGDAK